MLTIQIHPNAAAVAQAAARFILYQVAQRKGEPPFSIALSGGTTPKLMYDSLRNLPGAGPLLNQHVQFFFSDERAVPPESEQSNFRTAKVGLFDPLGIDPAHQHRMRGEAEDLEAEAKIYETLLRQHIPTDANGLPAIDILMLGMGPDGHTASLFPDYPFDRQDSRLIAAPYVASQQCQRLTFTLPLINAAKTVLFMVAGLDKREAVKKVLSASVERDILPARRVEATQTIWVLDADAAGQLDPQNSRGPVERC